MLLQGGQKSCQNVYKLNMNTAFESYRWLFNSYWSCLSPRKLMKLYVTHLPSPPDSRLNGRIECTTIVSRISNITTRVLPIRANTVGFICRMGSANTPAERALLHILSSTGPHIQLSEVLRLVFVFWESRQAAASFSSAPGWLNSSLMESQVILMRSWAGAAELG